MNMSKQSYSICLMLVSILVASCQSFGVGTPAVTTTPTASFTPTPTLTPTSVPSPTPTPIREGATPPVLRDGQYQVVMPQVSLLFSYRQEKVRQIDGDESHFRLGLNIRNSAITITIFPRNGDSLEQLMRNEELYWDPNTHKTSEATPNGLAQLTPFLVDGSAALRTLLLYNDLRVAFAIIERGDQCVLVIAWGGEMDGDVIYPESDRQRIYDLFNELLATFRFSTKDS